MLTMEHPFKKVIACGFAGSKFQGHWPLSLVSKAVQSTATISTGGLVARRVIPLREGKVAGLDYDVSRFKLSRH